MKKGSFSSVFDTSLPKIVEPVRSSVSGPDGESSSVNLSLSSFAELDVLLANAFSVSLLVPTTTARLSHTAGFLPPEQAFNEESFKDELSIETSSLQHIRNSISHVRQSVAMLKSQQDARCKPFEVMAAEYVRTIAKEDAAPAGVGFEGDDVLQNENVSYFFSYSNCLVCICNKKICL